MSKRKAPALDLALILEWLPQLEDLELLLVASSITDLLAARLVSREAEAQAAVSAAAPPPSSAAPPAPPPTS